MKTYKNLYPQIYTFENLYTAYRKARAGKRSRVDVAAFEFDMEQNLLQLQRELRDQTYRPGPYTTSTSVSQSGGWSARPPFAIWWCITRCAR